MRRKLLNLCLTVLMSAVCTAAWALSEVNGVYQIGTAAELEEFAALVNGENPNANAVLTADIEKEINGVMIGLTGSEYEGIFDGQGHTITVNIFEESVDGIGLFQYIGRKGIVRNLKVQGEITTGRSFAGGLAGYSRGIIRGCYIDIKINSSKAGDATHGGIVGKAFTGTVVENCLVKLNINGATTQNCGGIVGWADGRTNIVNCLAITDESNLDISNGLSCNIARKPANVKALNLEAYSAGYYAGLLDGACYNNYVTKQWGTNEATTVVPLEDLADGRICYQLNNDQSSINWVQRIGTDPFPVPAAFGTGVVYASGPTACDGKAEAELTFSNSGSAQATPHTLDAMGVCTTCGYFDFHAYDAAYEPESTDRAISLGSVQDIDRASVWNDILGGFKLNMKMVNDIEYVAEPGHYIFSPNAWVDGNFDGQGHTLTIEMSDMGALASFIPEMCGNFENVIMHGTIGTTSGQNAGSISGHARMALVRNVYSDITINSEINGDNSSGGFFGAMYNAKTVENCIYAGDFVTPRDANSGAGCVRIGGFAGWAHAQTLFNNCAFLGNLIGAGGAGSIENSQHFSRNPGSVICTNCYVANVIEGPDVSDYDKFTQIEDANDIESGALAFALNGKQGGVERFYQVIGTDPEPMPIKKAGGLVYVSSGTYRCDGTPIGGASYTNNATGEPVIPPHDFVDGWCTVCGQMQPDYLTPVDGFYEINDGAELAWWANYAGTHPDASARLTEDIDMEGHMDRFVPAGSTSVPFVGEFDGQRHTISNLVVDNPTKDCQGLISAIGDGAVIHDLILDESCSISGNAFCGLVGRTINGGEIYMYNVGNEGDVSTVNQNAAGLIGVCDGQMAMHIDNCWVTGYINGGRESGAIFGYSANNSTVTNCWSTAQMPSSAIYDCDSFTRGSAKVVNCYEAEIEGVDHNKQQHYRQMGADRATIKLPLEEVESGALCYNLNGKKFTDPVWFQTLDQDEHPYPWADEHNIIIYGAEQYFSIAGEEDLPDVIAEIQSYEKEAYENPIATQSLIDAFGAAVDAMDDVATFDDLAKALDDIKKAKDALDANIAVYKAYIDKCEEVKTYLAEHNDFEGELRTALEAYLNGGVEEPSEDNPLGSYEYITDVHTATAEEIAAETERVTKWLAEAIVSGYVAGTDVSNLIPNSDFSQQNANWTGGFGNGWGETEGKSGKIVGVEAWNTTGEMYQTVEDLKPGYYLVGVNAAFRPSNNRYSYNYAAGIYANGIFNYFPTAIEDYVSLDDAQDGVNCNLTVASAYDLPVYEDLMTTEGEYGLMGYVVQGPTGMAIAANAGRYQTYTIANVGEDGKLTIGIKNPGTKYGNDWTGWGPLKVTYLGEDADAALSDVIENMTARAETMLNLYYFSDENAAEAPNYPNELHEELQDCVDAVAGTTGVAGKAALVKKFSDTFQAIYEGKQAYVHLNNFAQQLDFIALENLELVEKDTESGEWIETGDKVFSDEEVKAIEDAAIAIYVAYTDGSYSTEEALHPEANVADALASIVPAQDADGYYLIGTTKQFVAYRAIASEVDKYAKGKLTADIDMAGIAMLPIGHNRGENAIHIFAGELDGQNHGLLNVYIDDNRIQSDYGEPAALFYELQNATVKNLKLTGEMYTSNKFSGPVTRYMSGKSTINNCEVEVTMHFAENLSGDASSGGLIGYNGSANSLISNCLVNSTLIGEGENPIWYVGGIAGWSNSTLNIKNCLITSKYVNVGAEGDNSQTISRGTAPAPSNVFVTEFFRGQQGTLVTPEQLASGETAWKLNGSSGDNPYWFQTLGTEAAPHLFGGDVVYYYAGQYTNDKPNPQLNAFAYNLDAKLTGNNVVVKYDLNAEAEDVKVGFYDGETLVYTAEADEVFSAGTHTVTVPTSNLGENPLGLNFKIEVTGKGTLDVIKMGDSYKVWGPYGLAVNNNPESKNFGQVLIAESYPDEPETGYMSSHKPGALYAFDPMFQPVNAADGTPGFYGGLPIKGETPLVMAGTFKFDLEDVRFTEDGRLFVARASGTSNSSVWEINPDDLDEPWTPVFTGGELDEATGITYLGEEEQNRMAISIAFEGKGDDLRMYVLGGQRSNGGYNTTDYNCAIYDLGTQKQWSDLPSDFFLPLDGVYTYSPYYAGIQTDGNGGLWFIQSTSAPSEDLPAIKHFDATGKEDYSNITSVPRGARIAMTTDGNYLAFPNGNGSIVLYETNYVPMANGMIFLQPKTNISVGETAISSLAFDYANNLYVASAGSETFSRYAIPGMPKVVVTPGNGITVGSNGDVNGDGKVDIADAVTVLNIMAEGLHPANADVNGDGKVDIADFVSVLNIMAEQ